jgi:hypothetical protein
MIHLDESRLVEVVWDGAPLSAEERAHLSICAACEKCYSSYVSLRGEFAVAQASQVSEAAESRLVSLFTQHKASAQENAARSETALRKLLDSVAGWVQALPLWDSREQGAPVGVRGMRRPSYRLLFGAAATEVELMVEPQNGTLRIVGEVLVVNPPANSGRANSLALIELMATNNERHAIEAESDVDGHFMLDSVPPGTYVLTVTPRYSQMVVIDPLELT